MTLDVFNREDRIRAARAAKVAGLVRALSSYAAHTGEKVSASDLESWTSRQWETLSTIAGVHAPSQTSIDAVIAAVREKEQPADDWAERPVRQYLDRFPGRSMKVLRSGGEWFVTVENIVGRGKTLGEAMAHAMNAAFVAEQERAVGP